MKDIQDEVNALELAMQVATDIKDKPYAYAVVRIQEALLSKGTDVVKATPVETKDAFVTVLPRSPGWKLSIGRDNTRGVTFDVTSPSGCYCAYQVDGGLENLQAIIDSFNDGLLIRNVHLVNMEGPKWYFRDFSNEISIKSVHASTLGEKNLIELKQYIDLQRLKK